MGINVLTCECGSKTLPQRYVLAFMTLMALLLSFSNRVCLHIAITEMVIPIKRNNTNITGEVCKGPDNQGDQTQGGGTLSWSEKEQGAVLSSFFFGYVLSHLPGGIIADELGGKHVLAVGVIISSILNILTPVSTRSGSNKGLIVIRVIMGLAQGPLFPSVTTLLSKWVPITERSTLGALVITGGQIGTIAGHFLTSVLIIGGDWSTPFYFWGFCGIIWYILFMLLCYSDPAEHPHITPEEKLMLEQSVGKPQHKLPIPWKRMFSDKAVWGLIIGSIGHDWLFFLILVQLPKYMSDVLKFNIKKNGVYTSVPYIGLWFCSTASGVMADRLVRQNKISVVNIRRLLTAIGHALPSFLVMVASYMGCNGEAAALVFCICIFTMGFFYPGIRINFLDITKNFAGILMSLCNGAGALGYFPMPYIIGSVTTDHTIEEWRAVFFALCVAMFVTTTWYILWAAGERRDWDYAPGEVND